MMRTPEGPTRTCVGCGSRDAQASMIRLRVRDGAAIVPAAAVPAGRSAYVHGREGCVSGLVRSKGLAKSLRMTISKQMRLELVESLVAGAAKSAPAPNNDRGTVP
jgi:uncharacterized protein